MITFGPHTPACLKALRIAKARKTRFLNRYQKHCTSCSAYGYVGFEVRGFDWVEWDEEECAACLKKGICPRCASTTLIKRSHPTVWEPDYRCTTCQWQPEEESESSRYSLPHEPECSCAWAKAKLVGYCSLLEHDQEVGISGNYQTTTIITGIWCYSCFERYYAHERLEEVREDEVRDPDNLCYQATCSMCHLPLVPEKKKKERRA
jgi:hypothetical protein